MCPETKDRCLFILKWRVSNTRKGMCSLPKLPVKQNAHVLTSAFLYYFLKQPKKQNKTNHLLQQETQACSSVPKCTSEMCPSLTCVKSGGPRHWQMSFITLKAQHTCCDNRFHLRNGICIWGEKTPESRFLSCLLVSVTLVHKSSQNLRSGRKSGTLKMRKQKPRAEVTGPWLVQG